MKKRLFNNGAYARELLCLWAGCNLLLESLFFEYHQQILLEKFYVYTKIGLGEFLHQPYKF